jgi:NAD(P)-dependent dehydrogenase (short-subunit alcohol dehydrogenase family)
VLLATNEDKLKETEQEVKKINPAINVLSLGVDIASPASVDAAFEKIKSTFGHADILVNNAGVNTEGNGNLIGDEDPDAWWQNFEVNGKGTFLVSRAFIRLLPKDAPATVITLVTGAAWQVFPNISGYSISKAVGLNVNQHIAAGYPNITAVSLHPGLVDTDMLMESFRHFTLETPELVGGVAVWLSHPHAHFLSGRTIASQWSVDDLLERKDEITSKNLLRLDLTGELGAHQFQ